MHQDIQKLVDAGKLTSKLGETLSQLTPGTWVLHKSWGFGRVDSWNTLLGQAHIDFGPKKAHPMQFQYAAETLALIPDGHFLVRRTTEKDSLKALAQKDPVGFLKIVLGDHDNRLTVDQITRLLVPDLFSEAEFKKWWESTKKIIKKDGLFALPGKKTEPVVLREQALSRSDDLIHSFKTARQLKDQLTALDQITRNLDVFQGDIPKLQEIVHNLGAIALQNQKLQTALALEMIIGRDEMLAAFASLQLTSTAPSLAKMLRDEESRLHEVLPNISAARQRRILAAYPEAFPERWVEKLFLLVQRANARIVGECAKLLLEKGSREDFIKLLDRALSEHSIGSEGLLWLSKERDDYPEFVNPRLLAAIISALERDQFSEVKRGSRLHDLLLEDRDLIPDIVAAADLDSTRDIMRKMMLTPVFEELNKRSLLARIIKIHPEMQALLTGEINEKQEALIVSWVSLEKRKNELEDLTNKQIPENRREIQIARDHGDLRENFEYKSAKDFQRVLMRRKTDLEIMLNQARGTGFENPDTTRVSIGTIVTVADTTTGATEQYTILGAWDSEPEQNLISYLTAIGQALLGHEPGEEVELPADKDTRKVRIGAIAPYTGELATK